MDPSECCGVVGRRWRDSYSEVTKLRREVECLRAENEQHKKDIESLKLGHCVLRVASPITEVHRTYWKPDFEKADGRKCWKAWCPCCKRPLELTTFEPRSCNHNILRSPSQPSEQRCAYVITLWGEDSGYVLGALVLGQALKRRLRTPHDLVLLHTCDVPGRNLNLLSKFWKLKCVDHVRANEELFLGGTWGNRFSGVFTKLQALSLVEYEKILMLDIDLAILDSIDALFLLKTPAA